MVHHPHITLKEVADIQVPVLVLVGDHDMVKEAHSKELAATIPHAQLQVIHGSHFIANENYKEYNQCVLAFLKKFPIVL